MCGICLCYLLTKNGLYHSQVGISGKYWLKVLHPRCTTLDLFINLNLTPVVNISLRGCTTNHFITINILLCHSWTGSLKLANTFLFLFFRSHCSKGNLVYEAWHPVFWFQTWTHTSQSLCFYWVVLVLKKFHWSLLTFYCSYWVVLALK